MIRDQIVEDIIKEVCGPDPHPAYIDIESGEEILLDRVHGSPKLRYGAGMLYPQSTNITELDENTDDSYEYENKDEGEYDEIIRQSHGSLAEDGESDESIGLANEFLPSAMGFTCKMKLSKGNIIVNVKSAWYEKSENGFAEKRIDGTHYVDKTNRGGDVFLRRYWTRRPLRINEVVLSLPILGSTED